MRSATTALGIVLALVATGCGGSNEQPASGSTEGGGETDTSETAGVGDLAVKAGVIGPESSVASQYWTELIRGFDLGSEVAEERFGVTFETVEKDTAGEPEKGAQLVQELLNEDQVDVIFGPSFSGVALQAAPIIQRTGRPWMTGIPVADAIIDYAEQPNWAFRTNYNNAQTIEAVGDVAFSDGASVAMMYGTDGFGQAGFDAVSAWAETNGHELVAAEGVDVGAPDVTPQISRLRDAGAEVVITWFTTGSDQATMLRGLDQLGYDPSVVATATVLDPAFTELSSPEQWDGMVFPAPMDFSSQAVEQLVSDYEKAYGEEPLVITGVWSVYAATVLYAQAVAEVGDPSDHGAVRDALEGTSSLDVLGQVFENPFSAEDHELFDLDGWFLYEYGGDGETVNLGPAIGS